MHLKLFVTDRAPNGSLVNGHFNKSKNLSDSLFGGHTACNSNYVATVDSNCWLSSKNVSPHQTMCAHIEEDLLRRIAANRRFVANIA